MEINLCSSVVRFELVRRCACGLPARSRGCFRWNSQPIYYRGSRRRSARKRPLFANFLRPDGPLGHPRPPRAPSFIPPQSGPLLFAQRQQRQRRPNGTATERWQCAANMNRAEQASNKYPIRAYFLPFHPMIASDGTIEGAASMRASRPPHLRRRRRASRTGP